jgi:hypothetical protein
VQLYEHESWVPLTVHDVAPAPPAHPHDEPPSSATLQHAGALEPLELLLEHATATAARSTAATK